MTPLIGAEVFGLDLSLPLGKEHVDKIKSALYRHLLLLFRGQSLTPARQIAFGRQFGELEETAPELGIPGYPEIFPVANHLGAGYSYPLDSWHTDKLWQPEPASISILYGVKLPARGGETQFRNAYDAYESLPAPVRKRLAELKSRSKEGLPIVHPVVRTHPVTGKRALFCNFDERSLLEGGRPIDPLEHAWLMREIQKQYRVEDRIYTHRYRPGDLLMWDNAASIHRGTRTDPQYPRLMHRVTVKGTMPY